MIVALESPLAEALPGDFIAPLPAGAGDFARLLAVRGSAPAATSLSAAPDAALPTPALTMPLPLGAALDADAAPTDADTPEDDFPEDDVTLLAPVLLLTLPPPLPPSIATGSGPAPAILAADPVATPYGASPMHDDRPVAVPVVAGPALARAIVRAPSLLPPAPTLATAAAAVPEQVAALRATAPAEPDAGVKTAAAAPAMLAPPIARAAIPALALAAASAPAAALPAATAPPLPVAQPPAPLQSPVLLPAPVPPPRPEAAPLRAKLGRFADLPPASLPAVSLGGETKRAAAQSAPPRRADPIALGPPVQVAETLPLSPRLPLTRARSGAVLAERKLPIEPAMLAAAPALALPAGPPPAGPAALPVTTALPEPLAQLATEQLGAVSVAIGGAAGADGPALRVHFAVDRGSTAHAISQASGALDRALGAGGARLETLSVQVRGEPQPQSQQVQRAEIAETARPAEVRAGDLNADTGNAGSRSDARGQGGQPRPPLPPLSLPPLIAASQRPADVRLTQDRFA